MQPSSSLLLAIATHYDERKISHLNIRRGDRGVDGCAVDKSGSEQRSSDSVGVCVGLSCLGKTYSLPAALNVYL